MRILYLVLAFVLLANLVQATDVAYVVKNTNFASQNVIDSINELNYTYNLITDSEVPSVNFSNYKMILVFDYTLNNAGLIPIGAKKSLVANTYYLDDWKIANYASSTASTGYFYGKIKVLNSITSGILTGFQIYTQKQIVLYSLPYANNRAKGIKSVVATDNSNEYPLIAILTPGASLLSGTVNERTAVFTLTESNYWTNVSKQLFKNTLKWVLVGEDLDGDGYYENDCNDSNALIHPGAIEVPYDGIDQNCDGVDLVDVDGDEFNSVLVGGSDCDDSDISKWQILQGYNDSDGDGFGSGNLLSVCSGSNLSKIFVSVSGDCNDGDALVNPNITEIAYDGIDQNCDGVDLVDVDGDGYNSILVGGSDCDDSDYVINIGAIEVPYDGIDQNCDGVDLVDVDGDGFNSVLVGGSDCDDSDISKWQILQGYNDSDRDGFGSGSLLNVCSGNKISSEFVGVSGDCNDNDFSINPNSDDKSKNCVNDAPVINNISKITVREGDVAVLDINAFDYDGDELSYSASGLFEQNINYKNIFTWQTGYYDSGSYVFKVNVSDGLLTSEKEFEVLVTNKNQAPICDNIPELSWEEDNTAELNLSLYCHDPDGDYINFYFNETSDDKNINLTSLVGGIAEFSSLEDWFGSDWIVFAVSDGKNTTITNKVILSVVNVDDAPAFLRMIENVTMKEDSVYSGLNLSDYFLDIDSNLTFGFESDGSDSPLGIEINGSTVSITPEKDWFGNESIIFSASDGENTVYSNPVSIEVTNENELPELASLSCESNLLEDEEYSCIINASDFEGDSLVFSILEEDNLHCSFDGDVLSYSSYKDYFGNASCTIRVFDGFGSSDYRFDVTIENVNDAPVIDSYFPDGDLKVLQNTNRIFRVNASDSDSIPQISWYLDSSLIGNGNSFLFNKPLGFYLLRAVVSDSEFNLSHTWNIESASTGEFTCSFIGGYQCSANQVCNAEILNSSDSSTCCSIACAKAPPTFERIRQGNKTSDISINIRTPSEDDEISVGKDINVSVRVISYVDKNLKVDVAGFLYDLTTEKIVSKDKASLRVDKEGAETIKLSLEIPGDINEGDEYAIFVNARDGDYYNSEYINVKLIREDYFVKIQSSSVNPNDLLCGDSTELSIGVENMGSRDATCSLSVKNSDLGLNKNKDFDIERSGQKDREDIKLLLELPQTVSAGDYSLNVVLTCNGESDRDSVVLRVSQCEQTASVMENENSNIVLNSFILQNSQVEMKQVNTGWIFGLIAFLFIVLVVGVIVFIWFFLI